MSSELKEPPLNDAGHAPVLNALAVLRTVRKYWPTALAVALSILLAVAFYTLGQTRIYQATAVIQFDPNPPRPLGKGVDLVVDVGNGNYWNNREYYETQYKIIQSMSTVLPVARQLGLASDARFLKNLPSGAQAEPLDVAVEDAALRLKSRLSVDPVKESRLAIVKYEDADPQRAQRILVSVVDVYVEQNLEYAQSSTTSAVDWLRLQLDKLREELESSERALHKYKKDKNILSLDLDSQSNMLREEMKRLNDEVTSTRAKRQQVLAQRNELAKIKTEDPTDLPAAELLASPLIQQLRQRYEDSIRERDGLLGAGKGASHPDVAAAQARVSATRVALLAEVRNIQKAMDRDLSAISKQESGLSGLFEAAQRRALELNSLEVDYNQLRRSRDNTEKLYSMVLERTKESDLARMMRVNNIRIVDRPLVPKAPVRPRVPLNIALGVFAGVVFGIAAAMGRALFDRTVKTPDDVETELGQNFLGLLPEIGSAQARQSYYRRRGKRRARAPEVQSPELIVHEAPSSGVAEAARAVRTNLLFMSPDRPYQTLLVTSPAPSEGKTTVAVSIAIAMAQAGQRVLLIDCDLRRPRIHRVFRRANDSGVTSALIDGTSAATTAAETQVPNLSMLSAGPIPPNPAELFHSERFKAFLESAKGAYDRVIIDSPPVVTVTDAAVLSTLVDGVVLVVRAFSTRKDLARHGIRAIRDVGGHVVGVVLNAVNFDRHEYKYHYYYYKRDGYYEQDAAPPSAAA